MRIEQSHGRAKAILEALHQCVAEQEDATAEHLLRHVEAVEEFLRPSRSVLQLSEARLERLALVAAFSPALSVHRACASVFGGEATDAELSQMAALCLGPMRRYFNRSLVQQVIRGHRFRMPWRQMPAEDRGYVERALVYSGDAHLQAVLDEYIYLLRHAGQAGTVEKALNQFADTLKLSRGNPRTNRPKGQGATVSVEENAETHAAHFALAFGEDISKDAGPDDDDVKMRKSVVREAFNSPFWPFVLATTSVGQEGLDFHLYCRDVLHWNLPSNPVDLEQREGRINRRDCLAVRESIAKDHPVPCAPVAPGDGSGRNPWPTVFETIERSGDLQKYKHGLFPHWVYECRNPAETVRIRRHVPCFSTSRDAAKYERLKTGLALYRLVFGQVNQEDLLETLQQQAESGDPAARQAKFKRLASYMLNLSPIGPGAAREYARSEATDLLARGGDLRGLRELLASVVKLQAEWHGPLSEVKVEIDALVRLVEQAIEAGYLNGPDVHSAVAALAYLRNPYDHIFDVHVEGGFVDDVQVIREACASIGQGV